MEPHGAARCHQDTTPGDTPMQSDAIRRIAVVALVALAVAIAWLPVVQSTADQQVDAGFKRAVAAFAAAKALNAGISLIQGTAVTAQPLGFGVELSVGEVLDPLNDLVEQFASLMLVALVAFGIQKVLLEVSAHGLVTIAVSLVAIAWTVLYWRATAPPWLTRILLVVLMVRFAMPVVTIGTNAVFEQFLSARQQQAQAALSAVSAQTGTDTATQAAAAPDHAAPKGYLQRFKEWANSAKDSAATDSSALADWTARIRQLQAAADRITDHVVNLMVVFVLQTVVVPLLLLWGLLKLSGAALRGSVAGTLR